jgi:hypothetical protein
MKKILIIKDYNNGFWETYPPGQKYSISLDVEFIKKYFIKMGYNVRETSYAEFDFQASYQDLFVIYGSSEDPIGGTKDYIEDVLLWLQEKGAVLIPGFKYFRAHHNKVFMEMLRKNFHEKRLKNIESKLYRSPDDIQEKLLSYPLVIKSSSGAGSSGVYLAKNRKELFEFSKRISKVPSMRANLIWFLRRIKRALEGREPPPSRYNVKFLVQKFIPNLVGDYKVLIFGDHYFVLHRLNRKNDFRASGAGIFAPLVNEELYGILDYAKMCVGEISAPCISLDIGIVDKECYLFEFQCISFGFKTMSWAKEFFEYNYDGCLWEKKTFSNIPEEEFCYAVNKYINDNYL